MTIASDFTRNDCDLGKRRITYAKLEREYLCGDCGAPLGMYWVEACESYPEFWHVKCRNCGSHSFIHEREWERQEWEAREVLEGLPAELVETMGYSKPPSQPIGAIFSLCPIEPVEL